MINKNGITFGILISPTGDIPTLEKHWNAIENLGFDSLWLPDHYYNIYDAQSTWFETWTLLAHMAHLTKKIKIGTLVSNFIYHNPAQLAHQALTVDHLSRGRLTVGLGAGSNYDLSHSMAGVQRWGFVERAEKFEEGVTIVNSLLTTLQCNLDGKHFRCKNAQLNPAPLNKPPLLLAAHVERSLRFAARHADIWNTTIGSSLTHEQELLRLKKQIDIINDELQIIGRNKSELNFSLVLGATQLPIYSSLDLLCTYIDDCLLAGINSFIFVFWPNVAVQTPLQFIGKQETLDAIARVVLPRYR